MATVSINLICHNSLITNSPTKDSTAGATPAGSEGDGIQPQPVIADLPTADNMLEPIHPEVGEGVPIIHTPSIAEQAEQVELPPVIEPYVPPVPPTIPQGDHVQPSVNLDPQPVPTHSDAAVQPTEVEQNIEQQSASSTVMD